MGGYLKSWDTGVRVYDHCPYRNTNYKLLIRYHVLKLCHLLDSYLPSHEFLVYADYRPLGNNILIIENPEIPEQEVSYASVRVITPSCKNVVIHKHPKGLKHFSGIDDEYINSNNDISILYESGEFVSAVMRIKVPCGVFLRANVKIMGIAIQESIESEEDIAKKIFEEQKDRIRKPEPKYYYLFRKDRETLHYFGVHI